MHLSSRTIIIGLTLLLVASLATLTFLYPAANLPLVRRDDAAWVEKARKDARAIFPETVQERKTFPIVMRLSDRICIELRSTAADGTGSYLVCYEARTGKKVEERSVVGF
ncbi:hypothetical protein SAMN05518849_101148 [Sphingobium sp. AP50]|uniref:hypothetical protein n=1 Tax=Sphingobium sp. AP50 TaxID=1884369 RepID=UPI0008D3F93E|nr:hypothetical protein [Sphingobium sp. AP50]SEI57875.1 hypothetical protein SAMN05518849_101148 [Sphingobium sp. AP50]